MQDPETLVLFQCHVLNATTLAALGHLHDTVGQRYRIEVLLDRGNENIELAELPVPVFGFESRNFANWGFATYGKSMLPGHCHFPLLRYAQKIDFRFKHIWLIEYDVRYSGDWNVFFDNFENTDADLLCCHLKSHEHEPGWYLWETYKAPPDQQSDQTMFRAFLVIARYSRAAIESVVEFHHRGGRGHQEVSIPMAIYRAGLSIQDFNWQPPESKQDTERLSTVYSTHSDLDGRIEFFGTVCWRPAFSKVPTEYGKLFHPVKTIAAGEFNINGDTFVARVRCLIRLTKAFLIRVIKGIDRQPLREQIIQ